MFAYSMFGHHINQLRVETRKVIPAPGTRPRIEWICQNEQGNEWQVANIQLVIVENDLVRHQPFVSFLHQSY